MKADIRKVMDMLDPQTCVETYELPNIMARETFRLEQERVRDFDALIAVCVRYYEHHFRKVMVDADVFTPELTRGRVWIILERGFEGGVEGAYRAAHTGINGGLPAVLDAIMNSFLKEQEEQWFNHTVMEAVDVMDLDDIKELMRQYLDRFGRHLDAEHLPPPEYLVGKYKEVLRAHAEVVRSIRGRFGR